MRMLQSRRLADLQVLDPAEEIVASTVTVFGQAAVLAAGRGGRADQPSDSGTRMYLHDGDEGWHAVPLAGPAADHPLVDALPSGEILLVGTRCRRGSDGTVEHNAHVFDPAGAHLRSFCLGDGVEHLGVDAAGTIWVSYFDEGVFGNHGWNDPIGAAGLVRFDSHGRRIWTYSPPSGAGAIADCYALNVDSRTTWIYYYTDFPLVQISNGRARAYAPTPIRGAKALVTYRDEVVFIGAYGDPLTLADCRLVDSTVQYRDDALVLDADGAPLHMFVPITARGSRLYLQTDHHILCVDLADPDNRTK
jgi:hypothetical protein